MLPTVDDPYTPQQRAALIAWWLAHGCRLYEDELMARLSADAAQIATQLRELARVLPIACGCAWHAVTGPCNLPLTPNQRAAYMAWWLALGRVLDVGYGAVCPLADEVASCDPRITRLTLERISLVLPIYDEYGRWYALDERALDERA